MDSTLPLQTRSAPASVFLRLVNVCARREEEMINKQHLTRFGLAGHEENKKEKENKFILTEIIQIGGQKK